MSHKLTYNDTSHSYWLDGKRCKSVTTVAKLVPDSYNLEQWRKRQVAIGFTLEPNLRERVAVDLENKQAVDQICDEALRIAGAHQAAHRGTQRHRASEIFDTGGTLITEQQEADARAWALTMRVYGIKILPEYVEGFAIWPQHNIAGRFDRIAQYRGRHVILDLKSGENSVKYPQGTAVQLALYANAPLISKTISTAGDKSTVESWIPPPEDLDKEWGYVVLLKDGQDVGELHRIKIEHGWLGAQHALDLVAWRKDYDYGRGLSELIPTPNLLQLIDQSPDEETLIQLWRNNKTEWTSEHTNAAERRKRQLAEFEYLLRGVA
jgi:hypothetical protein